MSRPRKIKQAQTDQRTATDGAWRQGVINTLRVDPYAEEPLAFIFAPVLLDRATDEEKTFVAELMTEALKFDPEQMSAFFARVSKLAQNIEQPQRNAYAYYGYSRFIEEMKREPSKNELKSYLLENPKIFKGLPVSDDKKAWTRLWSETGLSLLLSK